MHVCPAYVVVLTMFAGPRPHPLLSKPHPLLTSPCPPRAPFYIAPVEVVLPLHISHVVLCEGFGAEALELLLSFLYTGSVDINEGSPYVS